MIASLVLAGVAAGPAPAGAQNPREFTPDRYESKLTQDVIAVADDTFSIVDAQWQNYPDGENEQVTITGEVEKTFAVLGLSWIDDSDTPDVTLDLWVSTFAEDADEMKIVDAGLDGDVYWYFVEATAGGQDYDLYLQITEDIDGSVDMLESAVAVDGHLVDVVEAAQKDVTIGDDPFLDDVDLKDLAGLLDGKPFRQGDDDADHSGGHNESHDDETKKTPASDDTGS